MKEESDEECKARLEALLKAPITTGEMQAILAHCIPIHDAQEVREHYQIMLEHSEGFRFYSKTMLLSVRDPRYRAGLIEWLRSDELPSCTGPKLCSRCFEELGHSKESPALDPDPAPES